MKKFSIFLLVIAIIAALVYYFFPLEMLVKKAVNKYGSEVTGTSVNLSGFNINLKDGEASVKQITVANPQNYKTKYAVELGNIDVKVNLKSVTTDTIIVDKIIVNKPVISYEMKSLTENNISEIIDNVNKYTSSSATEPAQEEAKADSSSKKVIIKKVVISNGEINGAMTAAPDVISAAIPLPTLTLSNIGEETKGASVADSIAFIMNKLLSSVSTTVISSNLANLKDAANAAVDGAKDAAQGTVDAAKDTASGVVDGVKDTLSGLNPFGK
ncbi:MAG: AsmA family protein [Alphaproteobacteria bacterium]|nr:AsmA family protein [Alphaproteobacteria bacterium]